MGWVPKKRCTTPCPTDSDTGHISVVFAVWTQLKHDPVVTRHSIVAGRDPRLVLPDEATVLRVLDLISGDASVHLELHQKTKARRAQFRMHSLNTLLTYPVLRPVPESGLLPSEQDLLTAPVVDLLTIRLPDIIYFGLFEAFKSGDRNEFTEWLGPVFEAYSGWLLEESATSAELIPEAEIRRTYSAAGGKLVPDWVLVEDNTAILFECKASRLNLQAMTTGDETGVRDSLRNPLRGLHQCRDFERAILERAPGLERFRHCTRVLSVVVTWGDFSMMSTGLLKPTVGKLLQEFEGIEPFDSWTFLSIDDLEGMQPCLKKFGSVVSVMEKYIFGGRHVAKKFLKENARASFRESCLAPANEEIFERLIGRLPGDASSVDDENR